MKKLVFDIETNGLLHELDKILCLVTQDPDTGTVNIYGDGLGLPSISEGIRALSMADALIGHNIINFDLLALELVTGFKSRKTPLKYLIHGLSVKFVGTNEPTNKALVAGETSSDSKKTNGDPLLTGLTQCCRPKWWNTAKETSN